MFQLSRCYENINTVWLVIFRAAILRKKSKEAFSIDHFCDCHLTNERRCAHRAYSAYVHDRPVRPLWIGLCTKPWKGFLSTLVCEGYHVYSDILH